MWHFCTCSIWAAINVEPKLSKQLLDILDNDPPALFPKPAFIKWQEGIITLQCSSIPDVLSWEISYIHLDELSSCLFFLFFLYKG